MATQIQLRRGTAAEWTAANPVLAEGEMGVELDTSNFKIGNGINAWNSLDYGFLSLPAGGTNGQILAKDSNADYDFTWIDNYTELLGITIKNDTGSTLTKGQLVYINGASGGKITVALADATSEPTSAKTIGMVQSNISNGETGLIVTSGSITGLNTSGLTGGAPLWLSTTPGSWTATAPISPDHLVLIGYVENVNSSNGSIFVKTMTFPEIEELTGVIISTPTDGEVLTYEDATGQWKNKVLPSVAVTDLTDVDLTGLDDNYILRYDVATTSWKVEPLPTGVADLDDLTDVDLTVPPTDGQVLTYNDITNQWEAATPSSGGASALDDLTDVDLTTVTPVTDDVLTFDGTNWVSAAPTGGGGAGYPTITTASKTTASIATGVNEKSTITITQGYRLLKIETDKVARVRLYTTTTGRDNDETRPFGTVDPADNDGCMFDYQTTSADLSNDLNPVDGFVASGTAIPITITNLSGTTGTVTVTLTYVRTI